MSCTIDSGIAVGSASHVQLARDLLEHPAFLDARGVLGAGQLERDDGVDGLVQAHPQQIHVHGLPAHRIALGLLEDDRRGVAWPSMLRSRTAPERASASRSSRASASKLSESPPPP